MNEHEKAVIINSLIALTKLSISMLNGVDMKNRFNDLAKLIDIQYKLEELL